MFSFALLWTAIAPLLKSACIVLVGFTLAKTGILDKTIAKAIARIYITTCVPLLVFSKIVASMDRQRFRQVG